MNKSEVEQILISIKLGGVAAVFMKVYKDGTLVRNGTGGLPEVGLSALSYLADESVFPQLMDLVPQEALNSPINFEDPAEGPKQEAAVAFYGVSANDEHNEYAHWQKSTGWRFALQVGMGYQHALIDLVNALTIKAVELTDEWYFDLMMLTMHDARSDDLPEQTMIATPPDQAVLQQQYRAYLDYMREIGKMEDIRRWLNGKSYRKDGNAIKGSLSEKKGALEISFGAEGGGKKAWWKFGR